MATLTDSMIAVSHDAVKKGKVKPLGYITWFTVPDQHVSLRKVKKVWQLCGLDPRPLPKDPRAKDTFRRAMREQEKDRRRIDPDTIMETDVTDVVETPEEVVYQISRVARDAEKRVVEFPKAMLAIFNKVNHDISFKPLGGVPRLELVPMMDAINEYFDSHAKTVTGAQVRTLVRNYIRSDFDEEGGQVGLSGENMRGKAGGVYLVLARHAEQLDSLAEFLSEMYPDNRAYLYTVPLADGKSERELIRRHHVANTVDEIKTEIEEVRQLLRQDRERGVRSNVAQHHWRKLQQLRRRAAQYSDVLKEEQEEIESFADMLQTQLKQLV